MRILIAGASGLIGSELRSQLEADGHELLRLVRRERRASDEYRWYPAAGVIDPGLVASADAVINLSGASTGRLPWTPGYKREILRSRIDATRTLAEAINSSEKPPATFLSASAVGYYGDRPNETLTEESPKGTGILPEIVERWEAEAIAAPQQTRVVRFRTGLVVGKGGAFGPIGLLTRVGLGARIGDGKQFWPWIALYDEAAAIRHLLTSSLVGAVDLEGPVPATSEQITRRVAKAMHRWHPWVIPEFAIKALLGRAGKELLLPSTRIIPAKLIDDGFVFRYQTADAAIDAIWER